MDKQPPSLLKRLDQNFYGHWIVPPAEPQDIRDAIEFVQERRSALPDGPTRQRLAGLIAALQSKL